MDSNTTTCVQWATSADQKSLYNVQQKQGIGLCVFGGCYVVWALAILTNKYNGMSDLDKAIPLLISGAIAFGTGLPIAIRKDASEAYTAKTQTMLTAGWSSLLAPLVMSTIVYFAKKMNRPRPIYQGKMGFPVEPYP